MDSAGGFDLIPSTHHAPRIEAVTEASAPAPGDSAYGIVVAASGDTPSALGVSRDAMTAAGFTGAAGETLVLPGTGPGPLIAVGIGDPARAAAATIRDAAAAFGTAAATRDVLTLELPALSGTPVAEAAQAVVEGVLLGRYRYETLKRKAGATPVTSLTLVTPPEDYDEAVAGIRRGEIFAAATAFARDLANAPGGMMTAERMAGVATSIGPGRGLDVEVFDKAALERLGCGGLLGVNAGSVDPPRMIKLTYRPAGTPTGHLSLVGKGIMFDSGGVSLKPGDEVHAQMKNDMSGAGAILAMMSSLTALECTTAVTGYLMCTDNMPSGSATKLGDILVIHGGATVEVMNTDAEGRLVMADALVLATEQETDAVIDIATLTGACLRALGPDVAGVFGTDQGLVDQVLTASGRTGEPAWQLPLDRRYRKWLNSPIADIRNVGGASAGAITAALFLSEFVRDVPWAHIDIAGPAQNDVATSWRPLGCTGFGARLLLDLALSFDPDNLGAKAPSLAGFALTGSARSDAAGPTLTRAEVS